MAKPKRNETKSTTETEHAANEDGGAQTVEIDGKSYKLGDSTTVGGKEVTIVESKDLKASPNADIKAGTWVVVRAKNGQHYAVDGKDLHTIKKYGTSDEKIIKKNQGRGATRSASTTTTKGKPDPNSVTLSDETLSTIDAYLTIEGGDRTSTIETLVDQHLKPRVENIRRAEQQFIKLPNDLKELLGNAGPEDLQRFAEMLKKSKAT